MNDQAVSVPARLDIDTVAPVFMRALASLEAATTRQLDQAGIDPSLREIVRLRASQINGCTYCVNMHTNDAISGGETITRVTAVAVWHESSLFTARERAALRLTESITLAPQTHVPDTDWDAAAAVFTEVELGALLGLITTINAWNAVGVSARPWPVEG